MKQKLETATNICIIIFLVIVGGNYLKGRISPRPDLSQIKIGDELSSLPGYNWNSHPRTLVLALRYGCHYCEDSAPFYKRLIDLETSAQVKDVHIIAAFPDDAVVVQRALQIEGLSLDYIASVSFRDLKISATPTAILVDQHARVTEAWVGQLSGSEEQRLMRILLARPDTGRP